MELPINLTRAVKTQTSSYLKPLSLVTCVFFMWGLSYGLLDVLNKHFQEVLHISKAQSGLLQFAYFFAYFVVAGPAARFNRRFGYKGGILLGLCVFAAGALLFVPAAAAARFPPFLAALFVLACGLGCLETAANPYATMLGDQASAAWRLNMAQSFCSLGTALGPLIGGMFFFGDAASSGSGQHAMVTGVYVCLAAAVIVLAFFISITSMPEFRLEPVSTASPAPPSLRHKHFLSSVVAQFFSMAALVGCGAFFINYATESWPLLSSRQAAWLLSASVVLFMTGRFIGTFLMRYVAPRTMLMCYALAAALLSFVVVLDLGKGSVMALCGTFFFMSIMFATIFSIGIRGLGEHTQKGSAILMMSVIGGGISPYIMGTIADHGSISWAYALPLVSFVGIFVCAWHFRK
jgi:FHS family L-fucose permease-like MFS transporter